MPEIPMPKDIAQETPTTVLLWLLAVLVLFLIGFIPWLFVWHRRELREARHQHTEDRKEFTAAVKAMTDFQTEQQKRFEEERTRLLDRYELSLREERASRSPRGRS